MTSKSTKYVIHAYPKMNSTKMLKKTNRKDLDSDNTPQNYPIQNIAIKIIDILLFLMCKTTLKENLYQ